MLYLFIYKKDGGPEQLKKLKKGPEDWEIDEILEEIGGNVDWDIYEGQLVNSSDKLGLTSGCNFVD